MKKLINSPDHVLDDALVGVAAAHPSLTVNTSDRYIARAGGPTPGRSAWSQAADPGTNPARRLRRIRDARRGLPR